jgi:hypothetical protein
MSQTPVRERAKTPAQKAAPVAPSPANADFQAECDALAAAVAEHLEPASRNKPSAGRTATAAARPGSDPGQPNSAQPKPTHYPGEMEFVPAYGLFMKHAVAGPKAGDGADEVTVSRRLLEFLLRCLLDHMEFDEQQYQKANPDVAAAIKQKKMHSGREHFIRSGYFEGRSGGVHVDEAWYLARNPDVAGAKKAGKFDSGAAQYRLSGANEWRVPNQRSEDAIRMWKDILGIVPA